MIRDLRHAWRSIVRMPAVATVIIGSLAIGIAVNTVVFAWIQAIVLRPIAGVRSAAEWFLIEPRMETGIYPASSWPEYQDLRRQVRAIADPVAFRMVPLYVGEPGVVERGNAMLVSGNYFDALGLHPALGRFLRDDETAVPGGAAVAVISYDYWQSRYQGAPDMLGRAIKLNGHEMSIVGVAPPRFLGTIVGLSFDLWVPATMAPVLFEGSRELTDRGIRGYSIIGRLANGVSRSAAQADVDGVMRELARVYPETNRTITAEVRPFWQSPRGPQMLLAAGLAVLQGIMLLVLLAVCGNTATLVLARASARRHEMSVRLALGCDGWRAARLIVVENLLLAVFGAALGMALAAWGIGVLNAVPPLHVRGIPIVFRTEVSVVALCLAALLGVACGLVFGVAPAVQLSRIDPHAGLRGAADPARRNRLRYILMGIQVALATVVLVASGVFLRSFLETRGADTGFRRGGVLLAAYDLTGRRTDAAAARSFAAEALERIRRLPSVRGAAIASSVPLDIHGLPSRPFTLDGRARADGQSDEALTNTVTPGYFDVMGIPLVAGQDFVPIVDAAAPRQAIVNEEFVRRYASGREVIGRALNLRGQSFVIVAIARNSLYTAFGEPPLPIIYLSYRDRPVPAGEIHVHTQAANEKDAVADVRRAIRDLDPALPLFDVRTLDEHIEANLIFRRIPARLFAVIGPLLLVLAAIGIYAVAGYTVAMRRREIGVRLALGATPRRVVRQFLIESLGVAVTGAAAGWLVAFVLALSMDAGGRVDAAVFSAVPALLVGVAAAACWIPARRAARVDPMAALRQD